MEVKPDSFIGSLKLEVLHMAAVSNSHEIVPKHIKIQALTGSIKAVYTEVVKRPMKVSELQKATKYSNRTVRNALRKLEEVSLVNHYVDMTDLRSKLYIAI